MNLLEQLKKMTRVVSDSGEFALIAQYHPEDATTNPTLILQASKIKEYAPLVQEAVKKTAAQGQTRQQHIEKALDQVLVVFGLEILKLIPGRVSTEVDARLSFDTQKSIDKARSLIQLYEKEGISRKRILIKLASTWEGACAAKELEKEGIACNMTLMFSVVQAALCSENGATLMSPFVGRILDWYKKNERPEGYPPEEDPGVLSVREIYAYVKKFGYKTEVMGASFRNEGEILELAGCDLLTISPALLNKLSTMQGTLIRKLDPQEAAKAPIEKLELDEPHFRYLLNEDAMATEKLAEGIRHFARDVRALEELIATLV